MIIRKSVLIEHLGVLLCNITICVSSEPHGHLNATLIRPRVDPEHRTQQGPGHVHCDNTPRVGTTSEFIVLITKLDLYVKLT